MNTKFGIVLGVSVLSFSLLNNAYADCEEHYLLTQKNYCIQRSLDKYSERMEAMEKNTSMRPAMKQGIKETMETQFLLYTSAQKMLAEQITGLKDGQKCTKTIDEERDSKCKVQGQIYLDQESRTRKAKNIVINFESNPDLESIAKKAGDLDKDVNQGKLAERSEVPAQISEQGSKDFDDEKFSSFSSAILQKAAKGQ
jgi:hypothetical protein